MAHVSSFVSQVAVSFLAFPASCFVALHGHRTMVVACTDKGPRGLEGSEALAHMSRFGFPDPRVTLQSE